MDALLPDTGTVCTFECETEGTALSGYLNIRTGALPLRRGFFTLEASQDEMALSTGSERANSRADGARKSTSHAELPEPKLIVGRRLDGVAHGGAPRSRTTRLIDEIHGIPVAQKEISIAFPSVGRGIPGTGVLTIAVQEHERQGARIFRNLVMDYGVVAVQRLPFGLGLHGIEGFLRLDDGAARGELSLIDDADRLGRPCCRADENRGESGEERPFSDDVLHNESSLRVRGRITSRLEEPPVLLRRSVRTRSPRRGPGWS